DLEGSGLPPAKITLNNQEYRQPVEYKVSSDVAAIVDVNKAYLSLKTLNAAADASIKNINAIASQVNDFTLLVTGKICSGGASGWPSDAAPRFAQQGTDTEQVERYCLRP